MPINKYPLLAKSWTGIERNTNDLRININVNNFKQQVNTKGSSSNKNQHIFD